MNAVLPTAHIRTGSPRHSELPAITTPYARLGGADAVRAMVTRFYECLQELPEVWALREAHPINLEACRVTLEGQLSNLLGGPDAIREAPHHQAPYRLNLDTRKISCAQLQQEWLLCMRAAMVDAGHEPALVEAVIWAMRPWVARTLADSMPAR